MTRPDSEERVNDWFARHLTGWDGESSCGVGFTRRHALVEFTTAGGRELYVYVDAHGADHCDEIPAG